MTVPQSISINAFKYQIQQRGWVQLNEVLDPVSLEELRIALHQAYENCRGIQIRNGLAANTDGTVHHLLGQNQVFLSFLENNYVLDFIEAYFEAPFILNSYGGVINMKEKGSYVCNIHRDIRTFFNMPMMINLLVMLDDFTLENGATYLLSGSHTRADRPADDDFFAQAERATGKAGTLVLFDSLIWHAAGINHTDLQRRALTLTFTRPFMKPQFDYPRCLGYEYCEQLSAPLKQVIGYKARVPSNLDEWYQPVEKRFYQKDQG